jgi:hypothetical protein
MTVAPWPVTVHLRSWRANARSAGSSFWGTSKAECSFLAESCCFLLWEPGSLIGVSMLFTLPSLEPAGRRFIWREELMTSCPCQQDARHTGHWCSKFTRNRFPRRSIYLAPQGSEKSNTFTKRWICSIARITLYFHFSLGFFSILSGSNIAKTLECQGTNQDAKCLDGYLDRPCITCI